MRGNRIGAESLVGERRARGGRERLHVELERFKHKRQTGRLTKTKLNGKKGIQQMSSR